MARAMVRVEEGAELVLLDEPTAHLDADNAAEVRGAIRAMRRTAAIVMVSHDAATIGIANRVVPVHGGRWVSADAAASADAAVPAARADGRAAPARSRTGSAETPSAARDGAAPRASGVLRAASRDRIVVLVTHRAEDRRRPTPTSRGRRRILDPTPGGFSTRWPPVASTPSKMTSTRCRGGDRPESATPSCPVVRQPEHLSNSGRSSRWEGGAAQLIPTDSRPLGTPPLPPREPPVQSSR